MLARFSICVCPQLYALLNLIPRGKKEIKRTNSELFERSGRTPCTTFSIIIAATIS